MVIPDATVEAAAERLLAGIRERDDDAAALRFINGWVSSFREALAQEIEAATTYAGMTPDDSQVIDGLTYAARIVRGGTP